MREGMSFLATKENGHSLIELSICMLILGFLGAGAANLMQLGVKSELIARSQQQQSIAMQLFTLLQTDLASAKNVSIQGNRLSLDRVSDNRPVVYNYVNNKMTRTVNNISIDYPDAKYLPTFSISCNTPCFQTNTPITQMTLNNFSIVDSQFPPSQTPGLSFPITQATFSVVNGNVFI